MLEQLKRPARFEPQFRDELRAHPAVDVQRVRLPAAAVQGQHQLPARTFPQRLGLHHRLQLGEYLAVAAGLQLEVEVVVHHVEPGVLHGVQLRPGEADFLEIGENGPAPQVEGLAQQSGGGLRFPLGPLLPPLGDPLVEQVHVDPVRDHAQHVAGRPGQQGGPHRAVVGLRGEHPPQPVHGVLEDLPRRSGCFAPVPQRVQQAAGGHHSVRVEQQEAERRALLAPADRDLRAVVDNLHRAQYSELHHHPRVWWFSCAAPVR